MRQFTLTLSAALIAKGVNVIEPANIAAIIANCPLKGIPKLAASIAEVAKISTGI